MAFVRLNHPPLAEVLLELKWRGGKASPRVGPSPGQFAMIGPGNDLGIEPAYDLLLGLLYERLKGEYPAHEKLRTAMLPSQMMQQVVQHRFRTSKAGWPLVQLGPGILALNDARNIEYQWDDFSERAVALINHLFNAHPARDDIAVESLMLQYTDAEPLPDPSTDPLEFLNSKLHVGFSLPPSLFESGKVDRVPRSGINFAAGFPTNDPKGEMQFRIGSGTHNGRPAIVWFTSVTSKNETVPRLPEGVRNWLDLAHELCHEWFTKLVAGELTEKYSRE